MPLHSYWKFASIPPPPLPSLPPLCREIAFTRADSFSFSFLFFFLFFFFFFFSFFFYRFPAREKLIADFTGVSFGFRDLRFRVSARSWSLAISRGHLKSGGVTKIVRILICDSSHPARGISGAISWPDKVYRTISAFLYRRFSVLCGFPCSRLCDVRRVAKSITVIYRDSWFESPLFSRKSAQIRLAWFWVGKMELSYFAWLRFRAWHSQINSSFV